MYLEYSNKKQIESPSNNIVPYPKPPSFLPNVNSFFNAHMSPSTNHESTKMRISHYQRKLGLGVNSPNLSGFSINQILTSPLNSLNKNISFNSTLKGNSKLIET